MKSSRGRKACSNIRQYTYTLTDKVRPFRRNMYYGMPCGYTMTDKVRPFRRNMYYGMPCGYI